MSGNACPICGGERSRTIAVREHRFVQDDVFAYAVCAQCRLVRLLTPPVAMEPYYADYYYHTAMPPRDGQRRRFGPGPISAWQAS